MCSASLSLFWQVRWPSMVQFFFSRPKIYLIIAIYQLFFMKYGKAKLPRVWDQLLSSSTTLEFVRMLICRYRRTDHIQGIHQKDSGRCARRRQFSLRWFLHSRVVHCADYGFGLKLLPLWSLKCRNSSSWHWLESLVSVSS